MLTDPELASAVSVVARHYPSTESSRDAKKTGKPLWSSEDYAASNTGAGGRCEARIVNQNYVRGLMTATVNWNLISSYYDFTEWPDDGTIATSTAVCRSDFRAISHAFLTHLSARRHPTCAV